MRLVPERYKFALELRDVLNAGCCVCECNNNFIVQEVELVDVDVGWWLCLGGFCFSVTNVDLVKHQLTCTRTRSTGPHTRTAPGK